MPTFGEAERRIASLFTIGSHLNFKGEDFIVANVGKPTCSYGEPKTDIYILLENTLHKEEIKISYKKENADFLENKTSAERAEQLFGPNWRTIIMQSTLSLQASFLNKTLIFKNREYHTEAGAITLGWKFELLNKSGGELSGLMNLTPQQVYDVYAGSNLSSDKKNAYVNGYIIPNSGVANYILMDDYVDSAQTVLDRMISIAQYTLHHPYIYFACKALNFRTFHNKWDGDRPLSVQVVWFNDNGKLNCNLQFNQPLECNGNQMANNLLVVLNSLGITTTDDINQTNNKCRNIN